MQDRLVRQAVERRGGYPTKPRSSPRAVRAEGAERLLRRNS